MAANGSFSKINIKRITWRITVVLQTLRQSPDLNPIRNLFDGKAVSIEKAYTYHIGVESTHIVAYWPTNCTQLMTVHIGPQGIM